MNAWLFRTSVVFNPLVLHHTAICHSVKMFVEFLATLSSTPNWDKIPFSICCDCYTLRYDSS